MTGAVWPAFRPGTGRGSGLSRFQRTGISGLDTGAKTVYSIHMSDGFRRPPSVREAAYGHLRDEILAGRLAPGQRVSEPGLARRLGVSRTPVREALQRLAQEGLVELTPARGARVRVLRADEVREVYEARALIEAEGARLAARHAAPRELAALEQQLRALDALPPDRYAEQMRVDLDFHTALVDAGRNRALANLYRSLRARMALVRAHAQTLSQRPATRAQHRAILRALRARDARAAAAAVRRHVDSFTRIVLDSLEGKPWT